jgi:transposase
MDEGRKRTILIAAAILAARKLAQLGPRPSPAIESCISDAITIAEKILQRIDSRWPTSNVGSNYKH